jgi:uncharacterized membrane protein
MSQSERRVAFIGAVTLLCSTLEYLIPKPLPFLRLGLANLPLLVILDTFSVKAFLAVLLLKTIGQGMVSGTLFSHLILISLAGTFSSGIAMYLIKRLFGRRISLVGVSLIGAFVSNLAQIQVAAWIAYGRAIWIAAPLMLGLGMVTSFILGFIAEGYRAKSTVITALSDGSLTLELPKTREVTPYRTVTLLSLVVIGPILLAQGVLFQAVIVLLMWVMQRTCHRRVRLAPALILLFSMVILSLAEPNGRVLFSIGRLAFTSGALQLALSKALRLIALLAASQCLVASNPQVKGRLFGVLTLSLSYFATLTHAFSQSQGRPIQRVDTALRTASAGVSAPSTDGRTISSVAVTMLTILVALVALAGYLV